MGIETRCRVRAGCLCDSRASKENKDKQEYERIWNLLIGGSSGLIVCVCLQERDDRFLEASEQFHRYGLCRLVQFYRPERPSLEECAKYNIHRRGGYGVWRSQRNVVLHALESKKKRCLLFEDDLVFHHGWMSANRLQRVARDVMTLPDGWGAFKLGQCSQFGYFVSTTVVRSWSFLNQAVLWSETGMKTLEGCTYQQYYQRKQKEGEIDCWMMGAIRIYGTFPQLVHQSDSETSNLELTETDKQYRNNTMCTRRAVLNRCHVLADLAVHLILPLLLIVVSLYMLYWSVGKHILSNAKHDVDLADLAPQSDKEPNVVSPETIHIQ